MADKTHRLVTRASKEQFQTIYAAAELEGILPSSFIRLAAVEAAQKVIERYARTKVSIETANQILAALDRGGEETPE